MFGNKRVRSFAGQALVSILDGDDTLPVMRPDIRTYSDVEQAGDLPTVYFWQKEDSGDLVLSINETRLANLVSLTIPYHDKHFTRVLKIVRDLVMKTASSTLRTFLQDLESSQGPD